MKKRDFTTALIDNKFNPLLYFHIRTGQFPHSKFYSDIRSEKLYQELCLNETNQPIIVESHNGRVTRKQILDFSYVMIGETIMIHLSGFKSFANVYYTPDTKQNILDQLQDQILKFQRELFTEKTIGLITSDSGGALTIKEFSIDKIELDLNRYYNEDFEAFNDTIMKRLDQRPSKGIALLHGCPGTGKTTYIRHIIQSIQKRFIYLPSDLSHMIGDPSFLSFLLKYPNSILIIEDAECVLAQRRAGSRSAVSNLLNLCDGLLSDCVNVQVLATFNCQLDKIDPAILRKGRIIGRYEFKALSKERTNNLLQTLGKEHDSDKEMTLAEIFNQEQPEFNEKKNEIGFKIGI